MRYIDEDAAREGFDEMLDEANPDVGVGGLTFDASRVLKELDPIAYRCGFVDWLDAESLTTDKSEADAATCEKCGQEIERDAYSYNPARTEIWNGDADEDGEATHCPEGGAHEPDFD